MVPGVVGNGGKSLIWGRTEAGGPDQLSYKPLLFSGKHLKIARVASKTSSTNGTI